MSTTQRALIRGLTTLVVLVNSFACAPMNPSQASLVGSWKVEWTCGVETLDLKSDGTYAYAIDFAAGGRLTDSGVWRITPKSERLSGAHVVLQNALEACSVSGDKLEPPNRKIVRLKRCGNGAALCSSSTLTFKASRARNDHGVHRCPRFSRAAVPLARSGVGR
jgi:hypothetical protein